MDSRPGARIEDSWTSILYEKLGISFDCNDFNNSCLYQDCLKPYLLNASGQTDVPYYFVVLLVQLQCKKAEKVLDRSNVKITTQHNVDIIQFPTLLEIWKNQFDNYDIWKKPDYYTKWINLLTVGPFVGHNNAQIFEKGWTNIARGLTTKIVKVQSLIREYNREMDQCVAKMWKKVPKVKIYITPLKREEHFTIAKSTVYTAETIFDGLDGDSKFVNLNATYKWCLTLTNDRLFVKVDSNPLRRLCDLANS